MKERKDESLQHRASKHNIHSDSTSEIICLVMCPISLLFHLGGSALIANLIRNGRYKIQHLLLLNYSVCVIATGSTHILDVVAHHYLKQGGVILAHIPIP